jgi:hypothetical protein
MVKAAHAALNSIDIAEANAFQSALDAFRSVRKVPTMIDSMPIGTRLCRSRTHWNHVLFTDIGEISVPRNGLVTSYGRCNQPNNAVFYCSEDRPTSYSELLNLWHDNPIHSMPIYSTISAWYTKREFRFVIVPCPNPAERLTPFAKRYGHYLDIELAKLLPSERAAQIEYYNFLYSKFAEPAKNNPSVYLITSAYTALALHMAGNLADGIMYPSVMSPTKGVNFAIRPDLINQLYLELRSVQRDKFRRVDRPPLVPNFSQVEYLQANSINLSTGQIGWCSYGVRTTQIP